MGRSLLHGKELNNILDNQEFENVSRGFKIATAIGLAIAYLTFSSMDYNEQKSSLFDREIISSVKYK